MGKFCPDCGTRTTSQMKAGRERDTCPECGYVQYALSDVGVGALVLRDGAVLLVERGIPPVGIWTIPTGYMEQDDNLESAVIREVQEEAGLSVTPVGVLIMRNIVKPERQDIHFVFLCEALEDQEPVPDGVETTQARFVRPEEFAELPTTPFSRWLVQTYCGQRPIPISRIMIPDYRTDAWVYGTLG